MTGRGSDLVSLHVEVADGVVPAVALDGEARFRVYGASVVRYPDGEEIDCRSA